MLRNISFIPSYTDLGDLVNLGDFLGQLVNPTNPTNRSDQPDQPIRPTRPTDPIWGILIKSGIFMIYALERSVNTYIWKVVQRW